MNFAYIEVERSRPAKFAMLHSRAGRPTAGPFKVAEIAMFPRQVRGSSVITLAKRELTGRRGGRAQDSLTSARERFAKHPSLLTVDLVHFA